jgi:hypothetical protein
MKEIILTFALCKCKDGLLEEKYELPMSETKDLLNM